MPQAASAKYTAQLKIHLKEFYKNLDKMREADIATCRKCVIQGAAAYVSVAQRHTPPALGSQDIPNTYYQSLEMNRVLDKNEKTGGMRVIYFLRECVRNPQTHRLKRMFGKLLRQGFEYVVVIHSKSLKRKGQWTYYKPCRTISEARKYATEDYRGLMRAAWGMGFPGVAGATYPPVFKRYFSRRPMLHGRVNILGTLTLDYSGLNCEIVNVPIPANSAFLPGLDLTSSIASVKSMNRFMREYLETNVPEL